MERRKVCRYFERGSCKKEDCPFVHVRNNRKECLFFRQGNCRKGLNCNFFHPQPEQQHLQELKKQIKTNKKQVNPLEGIKVELGRNQKQEEQPCQEHDEEDINEKEHNQEKEEVRQEAHQQGDDNGKEESSQPKGEQSADQEQSVCSREDDNIEGEQSTRRNQHVRKINFLLGLGDESSSESDNNQENELCIEPQSNTVQFLKIYPKKFPDLSKSETSKARMKSNEDRYFHEKTYLELIKIVKEPFQKEYYQIIRKFQDSFVESEESRAFRVSIRPLLYDKEINLHFDFLEDTMNLEVSLGDYPIGKASIIVLNQSIPKEFCDKFELFLRRAHTQKCLFDTLKLVQNSFEKIYAQAKFKLENEYFSMKDIERRLKEGSKRETDPKKGVYESKHKGESRKRKEREGGRNKDVIEQPWEDNDAQDHMPIASEVAVESLVIQNCSYVLLDKVLLYIECPCEKKFMYIMEAGQKKELRIKTRLQCQKCQAVMGIIMQREVVQARHLILGRISVQNSMLIDLGGIGLKVGCGCDNEIGNNKLFLPGQRIALNCHSCFQTMQISYMGLKHYNPAYKTFQAQVGKELPLKGACKHNKLSFRWFRYGCCGRVFSCDDCHILGSVTPHQKTKGITMLCGFCSSEQIVAKDCFSCKKQLVKGVDRGGHWEGGLGCRDQTLLSKKDGKKYGGLTKKKPADQAHKK